MVQPCVSAHLNSVGEGAATGGAGELLLPGVDPEVLPELGGEEGGWGGGAPPPGAPLAGLLVGVGRDVDVEVHGLHPLQAS